MNETQAIQKYYSCANLTVPQHVIVRAVKNLSKLEALALIRGAYSDEGHFTTLADAQLIYAAMQPDAATGGKAD